ncbi:MAG: CobW family GTP-binding protein [Bacillota bacterium]
MRIPVIVLSGFLGSGKTTLLLRLLDEAKTRGLQPGVIMNELGSMDVDGHILNGHSDMAIEKLLDGCVCCSRRSELAGSIQTLSKQKPDVIFIELTGVANPEEIADALTEPQVLGLVQLKQIVTLLDAEHVLTYNSIFESDLSLLRTLRRQMETADLIIVNKTDLVTAPKLSKIDKVIRKQNDTALVIPAAHGQIDLNLLLATVKKQERQAIPVARSFKMLKAVPAGHHQDKEQTIPEKTLSFSRVQTMTLPVVSQPSRRQIEKFLLKFKDQLLRAKGYIRLKEEKSVMLMQYAGKRITWTESDYTGDSYIVFIGINLNEQQLEAEWNRWLQLNGIHPL